MCDILDHVAAKEIHVLFCQDRIYFFTYSVFVQTTRFLIILAAGQGYTRDLQLT